MKLHLVELGTASVETRQPYDNVPWDFLPPKSDIPPG